MENVVRILALPFALAIPFISLVGITTAGLPWIFYRKYLHRAPLGRKGLALFILALFGLAAHMMTGYFVAYLFLKFHGEVVNSRYIPSIVIGEALLLYAVHLCLPPPTDSKN